jgi:hypothetical protein
LGQFAADCETNSTSSGFGALYGLKKPLTDIFGYAFAIVPYAKFQVFSLLLSFQFYHSLDGGVDGVLSEVE